MAVGSVPVGTAVPSGMQVPLTLGQGGVAAEPVRAWSGAFRGRVVAAAQHRPVGVLSPLR
ncbi:hypothetical protein GCM10010171_04380 [Actinokineospora fastidiosa]|uniref:Uncharacterized protein n=1 Tax=Actinokineospora fastidiosa TaxID=1816 RepID=A0A918G318_9PSEU|nr:hypothetical protein GCM10010171_04380 [Actinokineospora fastidiosa]